MKHSHPTIFHALMDENIPAPERRFDRLSDEAVNTVGAGAITTAHTLGVITYFLLDSPSILRTLTAELKHAMPDKTAMPPLQQLEQLPYLSAVISEGLRMSYGVSHRLQRSAPDRSIVYKDYTIPPNTPVSMSSVLIHDNPDIFPDPHTFHPERWLDAKPVPSLPGAPPQRLDKYLLSFSKGTRACLGMNLAYAELYLALAHIFRTFEMKLFDTVRERDIDLAHDFFSPSPTLGSKGCRVTVVGRVD